MKAELSVLPIILCGGSGSRLWPLSTQEAPKQFQQLVGSETMFVQTFKRFTQGYGFSYQPARVIGRKRHKAIIEEQIICSEVNIEKLILEPCMRNTCAAIAASIVDLATLSPEQIVLVLPSDHHISDVDGFHSAIKTGLDLLQSNHGIVTFGIRPTRAETEYGYIEKGSGEGAVYQVKTFREKPDLRSAETYITDQNFLWNSGIFMFRVSDIVAEFERQQAELWRLVKRATEKGNWDGKSLLLDKETYLNCTNTSFDYGIMESAPHISVIESDFGWSDLGSWNQLHEILPKNGSNNVEIGNVQTVGVQNSYLRSEDRLLAVGGLDNIIVVSRPDALLITHRDKTSIVNDLHEQVRATNWPPAHIAQSGKIVPSKDEIRAWIFDLALPYWADRGIDYDFGGVHEALSYQGKPVDLGGKRIRVLMRQIYSFAKAKHYGWQGEHERILRHCFDTLVNTGWHDDGGWIHRYNNDGTVQDDQRDTYDHAFALLSCAALYQTTGWDEAKLWADKTLNYLDTHLKDQTNGGFFEGSKPVNFRRANPHMHYLEAVLEWFEVTGDRSYLKRAEKIIALFKNKFFDHDNWRLHEFFDLEWNPLNNDKNQIEPGHHYEWTWLLLRYVKASGDQSVKEYARKLYATALSFGHISSTDAAADTMDFDGSNLSDTARLWPQTEALKAAVAMEEYGLPNDKNLVTRMLDQIYNRYLSTPQPGGWFDKMNKEGAVVSTDIQASLLYHILCAFAEYLELEKEAANR